VKQAKGSFDGPQRAYTIDANDQLRSAAEYGRVVVAYRNGAPLYLSDVADVIEDAENVRLGAWMNDVRRSSSTSSASPCNVIEVVDRVKRLLPQLQASLPAAIDIAVLTDRTTTIRASVKDVQIELLLAVRAGRDGDFSVPAQCRRHHHTECRSTAVAGGHVRRQCIWRGSASTI